MNPDLFPILMADATVTGLLGNPPKVYPWGRAPQDVQVPYVVYGVYNGNPENYLDRVPDIDNKGTQIDIYDSDPLRCESIALAIRNALEPDAHMTSFATPDRESETDFYSCRLEFDFWENR